MVRTRFENKVIVVTGGSKGLGKAASLAFAREGGAVVIGDVDMDTASATVEEIVQAGGNATAARCDVRQASDVQNLIATAVESYGGLDVLYNNAGVVRYGTVEQLTEEDWDYQLDINLKGS